MVKEWQGKTTGFGKVVKKAEERSEELEKTFKPTPLQLLFVNTLTTMQFNTIEEVCEKTGIKRSTYSQWLQSEPFQCWFSSQWNKAIKSRAWQLDKIGMDQSSESFKHWQVMMSRTGNIAPNNGSNVNVQVNNVRDTISDQAAKYGFDASNEPIEPRDEG